MKKIFLIFLFPLKLFSQDITGVWTGSIYNELSQQNLHYELVINKTGGKYAGYSYTNFVIDNKEYLGVKSIKVVKYKDKFFVEDQELVYNNYPVDPPKGVKQITALSLIAKDTVQVLSGNFITTRTKQYGKQVTGTVRVERKTDRTESKLAAVMHQLKLAPLNIIIPVNNQLKNTNEGESINAIKNISTSTK